MILPAHLESRAKTVLVNCSTCCVVFNPNPIQACGCGALWNRCFVGSSCIFLSTSAWDAPPKLPVSLSSKIAYSRRRSCSSRPCICAAENNCNIRNQHTTTKDTTHCYASPLVFCRRRLLSNSNLLVFIRLVFPLLRQT